MLGKLRLLLYTAQGTQGYDMVSTSFTLLVMEQLSDVREARARYTTGSFSYFTWVRVMV